MSENTVSTNIEILGKLFPIRCEKSEVPILQEAADYLNDKMSEVQHSGKAINLERIAVITALNLASLYLKQNKENVTEKINDRIIKLQKKIDKVLSESMQADLLYQAPL